MVPMFKVASGDFAVEDRHSGGREKKNGHSTKGDTMRAHVAKVVKKYLEMLKWEILPHPPTYSPDVAPSHFAHLTHLTISLNGTWPGSPALQLE
nr:Mariner Mos1 transposase [Hymenolepis microstoma]